MSRRKKPTAQTLYIWEQVERITRDYDRACYRCENPVEAGAAWQKLREETVAGQKAREVDIDSLGWVLSLGWALAMTDRDYDRAMEILSGYFDHPGVADAGDVPAQHFRCCLATSLLYGGHEGKALEIYHHLLDYGPKSMARAALYLVGGSLCEWFSERAGDQQASPALADLVEEIVNRLRRRVPRKKRLPDNATYADLQRLLDSTYPPSGREALRLERESRDATGAE